MPIISAIPLTDQVFAPFGNVIDARGQSSVQINDGSAHRFHDLARVDVDRDGGRACVNIFVGQPFSLPLAVTALERHQFGSQAFIPLDGQPFLVVVAAPDPNGAPAVPQAFLAAADQGVNYHAGVWHHPLIALHERCRFLVIDRLADTPDVQVAQYPAPGYQVVARG